MKLRTHSELQTLGSGAPGAPASLWGMEEIRDANGFGGRS